MSFGIFADLSKTYEPVGAEATHHIQFGRPWFHDTLSEALMTLRFDPEVSEYVSKGYKMRVINTRPATPQRGFVWASE